MESHRRAITEGRRRRLVEELAEEGFAFVVAGPHDELVEELDYAMRPPAHEGRVPSYGAIVGPTVPAEQWTDATHLEVTRRATVDYGDVHIRRFADGFSSWALRRDGGLDELIVFDRSAGSERDMVVLASVTGGRLVQRHPDGTVRAVGDFGVVRHDLTGWHHEPPFGDWIAELPDPLNPSCQLTLAQLLDFAVHDLGARGIGATLIVHGGEDLGGMHEHRLPAPPELHIGRPDELAPLRHALAQLDGAAVFDLGGTLRFMGVRLVPSAAAEDAVRPLGGTRHTSALRYSHDDPDAILIVVSADGPVTVMRAGAVLGRSPTE